MTIKSNLTEQIKSLRVAVCDLNGNLRGKRIPYEALDKVLSNQMRMPISVVGVDVWGEDVFGSDSDFDLVLDMGDCDGLCEYTGRDIFTMDWTTNPTAMIPVWLAKESGEPYLADPRRALAAVLERFKGLGLRPVVATELEFYLFDPSEDRPQPPNSPVTGKRLDSDEILSILELNHFDEFFNDVYRICEQNGIPVDSAIAENGCGQFEINLLHVDDALKAADDAILFKQVVKGVARKHAMAASFMAKPYSGRSGSGLHIHFSLLNEQGENVFDDGSEKGSDTLLHAIGGMLSSMAESTLLFAPHYNSYRRLCPGLLAPVNVSWGYENRTTALRVPGGNFKARRIEHRVAGADANPYLVLASVLGAALIGIEQKIQPGKPFGSDAYKLKDTDRLADSWPSAVDKFNRGQFMKQIFDQGLIDIFVACKRQELKVFNNHVSQFEYDSYLEAV